MKGSGESCFEVRGEMKLKKPSSELPRVIGLIIKSAGILLTCIILFISVNSGFPIPVSASPVELTPPFEDPPHEYAEKCIYGFSDYYVSASSNAGEINAYTYASTVFGRSCAYVEGFVGKQKYIPSESNYRITCTYRIKGKIGIDQMSLIPSSNAGSRIRLGLSINSTDSDYFSTHVLFDEHILSIELRDVPQLLVETLAKQLLEGITGVTILDITEDRRVLNIDGTIQKSVEVRLAPGNYKFSGGVALLSDAASVGMALQTSYADFSDKAVYYLDPDPWADEYIMLEKISIDKTGGENAPPVAKITPENPETYVGQETQFYANESYDFDGHITQYYWEFQGGNPPISNLSEPTVRWNAPGIYDLKLKVKDNLGAWSDFTYDRVKVINSISTGSIVIDPINPVKMQGITFSTDASDPDGIYLYVWDFGDGTSTTTTVNSVIHSYDSTGQYNVQLTVIDNFDGTTTFQKLVSVDDWTSTSEIRIDELSIDGPLYMEGGIWPSIEYFEINYKGYANDVPGVNDYDIRIVDEATGIVLGTANSNHLNMINGYKVTARMDKTVFRKPGPYSLKVIAHHANGSTAEAHVTADVVGIDNTWNNDINILPCNPYSNEIVTLDASHLTEDDWLPPEPIERYGWHIVKKGSPDILVHQTPDDGNEPILNFYSQGSGQYTITAINKPSGHEIDSATIWIRDPGYS
jgi:PKD repeat protein